MTTFRAAGSAVDSAAGSAGGLAVGSALGPARTPGHYTDSDHERYVAEPVKSATLPGTTSPGRSPFSRDRARVLHSGALRRLAGKTQVVAPGEGAVPRTRLTHSLEVAQISRDIGAQLGCDPDLVDLAGLAHDIGHPPFGHNGEAALSEIGAAAGGFEANAQNVRLLTALEPKVIGPDGRCYGLNLTRASLDAVIKYPWPRPAAGGKFGVYDDDADTFAWIRADAPAGARCLEAQAMDWADDVAYSVHDVEDGVTAGRIDLVRLAEDAGERMAVAEAASGTYSDLPAAELADTLGALLRLPAIADKLDLPPGMAGSAALKQLTSELTGRFVTGAVTATRERFGTDALTRYDAALIVPDLLAAEVAMLKAIAFHYVMNDPAHQARKQHQQELLAELVTELANRGAAALSPAYAGLYREAGDDMARLRVVLDQVSLLTDAEATGWHGRLAS